MSMYLYTGKEYALEITQREIRVRHQGRKITELVPCAEVKAVTETAGEFQEHDDIEGEASLEALSACEFVWRSSSSNWREKEYRLLCDPEGFNFTVRLSGRGAVGQVNYFSARGEQGAQNGSPYHFCEYYIPCAHTDDNFRNIMCASQSYRSRIELLIPPPFCYSFRTEQLSGRFGLGMVARPGQYNFLHFDYRHMQNGYRHGFALSTDMEGHTKVDGSFELPIIRGFFGADDLDIVARYSEYHYANGLCKRRDYANAPRWWYGPIVCGWNEQERFAVNGRKQKDTATQAVYTEIADLIQKYDIHPTMLIIDDKWQKTYGECVPDPEKWPDMRAFTDEMHRRGIRVLLWLRLWGGEGLPQDEVMPGEGIPYGNVRLDYGPYADPTNPKYCAHMRDMLHTLLSDEPGCMNVDGFKLDYSLVMPYGKPAKSYGGQYGAEMTKRLYELIYHTAKGIKPDALINASPCHPYFAEVCDQARVHDYNWGARNETEQMSHRAKLFQAAMPGVLIDTDSVNFTDAEDAMRFYRHAADIGAPDIYRFYNDEVFQLTEEDWREIRQIFRDYSEKMDRLHP